MIKVAALMTVFVVIMIFLADIDLPDDNDSSNDDDD
jgi:hypothetical protein